MLKAKQAYKQYANTNLVSPQFHCQYNDFFETISFNEPETMMSSKWQILASLERPDEIPTVKQVIQRPRPLQSTACDLNPSASDQNPSQVPNKLSFLFDDFPT
ncbi:LOW QUALITY PROTEIN: hypothetical protein ACHAW6_006809 [Cyclotella cf. meneghiniana]